MLSLYRTLSLRFFQQRWSRALLVVASVASGVALLVATRAINASMGAAARSAFNPLARFAELIVTNGDAGVPSHLAPRLAQVRGVRRAEPLIFGRTRLPDLGDRVAQVQGITWRADTAENNPWGVTVEWTVAPESMPGLKSAEPQNVLGLLKQLKRLGVQPVLVGEQLAADLAQAPDTTRLAPVLRLLPKDFAAKLKTLAVRIQPVAREPQTFYNLGIVKASKEPEKTMVANALILDAANAAQLLGVHADLVTRIDLFLEPGADRDAVLAEVQGVVHGRADVRTPGEDEERVESTMAGLQLGFSLLGAAALVVGLFLIYLVLSVSVVERRHEIGILRALGATRNQVAGLFVGEAALLGLAGALAGIPIGILCARYLGLKFIQDLLRDFLVNLQAAPAEVTVGTVVVAAGGGIAVAVLAALVPAVQAAREEPASAVRRIPPVQGWRHRALQLAASVALLGAGAAIMVLRPDLPPRWATYGGFVLVLLGMLLTTPLLAAAVAWLVQPLARALLMTEGRLAADNLVRAPGRTGLVITVLAAGVAIFLQTAGVIRSNEDPILQWVDQTFDADLFIMSGSAIVGSGENLPLRADLARDLKTALPEDVEAAVPVSYRQADFRESDRIYLIAVDARGFAGAGRHGPLEGSHLYPRLAQPGSANAVVSENFAVLNHVSEGDFISIRGPHGPVRLHVAGVVVNYIFNRGAVIIDRGLYRQHFDDARTEVADMFYVYLRPGADVEAARATVLAKWGAQDALVVETRGERRQHFIKTVNRFAVIAYTQELVVGLVAALGVVFTLLISVLQRRRELGILRAIGATQTQVLRCVLAEAALMGAIGTLIGLAVGIPIEWYIMHVLIVEETGMFLPVLIPWLQAGIIAGGALAVATLAGLMPALRTMHLRIPEAIAYE